MVRHLRGHDGRPQAGGRPATCAALLVTLVLVLSGCGASAPAPPSAPAPAAVEPASTATPVETPVDQQGGQPITKVLTIVEENHSLNQMRSEMPYVAGLADRFGYADHYTAVTHPSLPNYLSIAGGDTFGVTDDEDPATHVLQGPSIFSQARDAGLSAGIWADAMTENCQLTPDTSTRYGVKHNAWAYFADDRAACQAGDVGTGFLGAAESDALPNVGMLIPNTCHDAHDGDKGCTLPDADAWLKGQLPTVLASQDFTSGALAVVITADEDDHKAGNTVLTVVLHASLDGTGTVVSTPLTHYSLSRFYSQVVGAEPLRQAADAPDLATAFRLPVQA